MRNHLKKEQILKLIFCLPINNSFVAKDISGVPQYLCHTSGIELKLLLLRYCYRSLNRLPPIMYQPLIKMRVVLLLTHEICL